MSPAHGMWADGWVLPALFGLLVGVIGYVIGCLSSGRQADGSRPIRWQRGNFFPGILLILFGLFFLIDRNWYPLDLGDIIRNYWPLILILVGLGMLFRRGTACRTDNTYSRGWSTSQQKGETII